MIYNIGAKSLFLYAGHYQDLKKAFSELPNYNELTESFLQLSNFFPLLTLHYVNFILLVKPDATKLVRMVCMCL